MGRVARQQGHAGRQKPPLQIPMIMLNTNAASSPWQPLSGRGVLRISRWGAGADVSGDCGVVKVCTVNVGSLVGRGREVVEMLARRNIDVCCLQEVRYKGAGTRSIGTNEEKFKLWYAGNENKTNGVGIMVKHDIVENVLEIKRSSDRLMRIKIVLGKTVVNIFSLYAPQAGRPQQEKEQFWELVEEEVAGVPLTEGLIMAGDVNAHIGSVRDGFEDVMGPFGFGDRNPEGDIVLSLCKNHDLRVLSTFFKKDREKKITYKSGGAETEIDLIAIRPSAAMKARDCKSYPGEACLTQHRPVCAIFDIKYYKKKRFRGQN